MSSPSSLWRNASWAFMGNFVYAIFQFALLSLLTKVGSVVMAGDYALALAITAPMTALGNLKLRQVLATDVAGEFPVGAYLGLRILTAPFPVMGAAVVAVSAGYQGEVLGVLMAVAVAKCAESFSDLAHGLFIHRQRLEYIARSQILRGVLALLAVSVGLLWGESLALGCMFMAVTWSGIALLDTATARGLANASDPWWPVFTPSLLRGLVWLAAPLGMVTMLVSLRTNLPRYFLEFWWGREAVGIYSCLAYILVAGNTVIGALGQAATPRLSNFYQRGHSKLFLDLVRMLVAMGVGMGALAIAASWLIGEPALRLLFDPVVASRADVLPWVALAAGVIWAHVFLGTAINAMRKFSIQLPIHLANIAITGLTGLVFIPEYGLVGAAWSLLAGALVVMVLNGLAVGRALGSMNAEPPSGAVGTGN